jgi:hypothetical protein
MPMVNSKLTIDEALWLRGTSALYGVGEVFEDGREVR